jgi:hypothetical protein
MNYFYLLLLLGRHVVNLFLKASGTRITTNNLRSLIETTARKALNQNVISSAGKEAIENIVGHGKATCLNYYILYERMEDVRIAYDAFLSIANIANVPQPQFIAEVAVPPVYGAAHPVKGDDLKVMYTDIEIGIAGVLVEMVNVFNILFYFLM